MAVVALLSSCGGKGSLTKTLEGSWRGEPLVLDCDSVSADAIFTYTFSPTEDTAGTVEITALISAESTVTPADTLLADVEVTSAGFASVSGRYEVESKKSIAFFPEDSTFDIQVTPDGTRLAFMAINSEDLDCYTTLRDSIASVMRARLYEAVKSEFAKQNGWNDITCTPTVLSCLTGEGDAVHIFRKL